MGKRWRRVCLFLGFAAGGAAMATIGLMAGRGVQSTTGKAVGIAAMLVGIGIAAGSLIALILLLAALPGRIARQRDHPYARAVAVCGWLGLLAFPAWIFALAWSLTGAPEPRKPTKRGLAIASLATALAVAGLGVAGVFLHAWHEEYTIRRAVIEEYSDKSARILAHWAGQSPAVECIRIGHAMSPANASRILERAVERSMPDEPMPAVVREAVKSGKLIDLMNNMSSAMPREDRLFMLDKKRLAKRGTTAVFSVKGHRQFYVRWHILRGDNRFWINGIPECFVVTGSGREVILCDPNVASVEHLVTLPSIGKVKAKNIVAYRQSVEPPAFKKPEDLLNVRLIAPKTVEIVSQFLLIPPHLAQSDREQENELLDYP